MKVVIINDGDGYFHSYKYSWVFKLFGNSGREFVRCICADTNEKDLIRRTKERINFKKMPPKIVEI